MCCAIPVARSLRRVLGARREGSVREWNDKARDLVNGFFIGGDKDDLQQPNLTKGDLIYSIAYALKEASASAFEKATGIAESDKYRMILSHDDVAFSDRDKKVRAQARKEVADALRLHSKGIGAKQNQEGVE